MTHSLVIGGTKGLGRVVARQLAARGDIVSVIGRTQPPAEDLDSRQIHGYLADVTDRNGVKAALRELIEDHGKIDYCVFLQRYRGADDQWQGELQTTLTATKQILEELLPDFSRGEDNGIVMVSSVFSKYVGEGQNLGYHVAKAGLDQMIRYYAVSLGGQGIRVNGVTPFTFLKEESQSFYLNNAPLLELYENMIPLKRMARADDSASVITFLCSPPAAFVSGQNITVDGGLSLVWPETLARRLANL